MNFVLQNEFFAGYKQAHRRDDDIAIVNAGMKVVLNENNIVQLAAFAFGGMAPITTMALKTMKGIIGRLDITAVVAKCLEMEVFKIQKQF